MPLKLKIKWYDYDKFYNETSIEDYDDYDDSDEFINIPGKVPLEGDEEKVKRKWIKNFNSKQIIN